MTIKQFTIFFAIWVLSCSLFLEPTFIEPLFETGTTINMAFNGSTDQLGELELEKIQSVVTESMDHFRVLCLLYFGLPAALYLATQLKKSPAGIK